MFEGGDIIRNTVNGKLYMLYSDYLGDLFFGSTRVTNVRASSLEIVKKFDELEELGL